MSQPGIISITAQDSSSRILGLALRRGRGLTLTLVTGVRKKVRRKPPARNTQLVRLDTGQGCRRRDSFKIAKPFHMLDQGVFSAKTR